MAVLPPKPECSKIFNQLNNYPDLKSELIALDGMTTETQEKGKYRANNTIEVQELGTGDDGMVEFESESIGKYYMIAHTHNSPADSTYSVFSWHDFYAIKDLLILNKIKTSKFVFYLMTADETRYAMTINNKNKFLKFFATKLGDNFDMNINKKRVDERDKYYAPYDPEADPLIIEESNDNLQDLKYFLSFLQDNDLGLTLFEVDQNFNTFEKLTYNKQTDNVDHTGCN